MMSGLAVVSILLVGVLLAANGYVYWRSRPGPKEEVYRFACPECNQRLRYRARQVGHAGMCPRCKTHFTFPAVPEKELKR